MANALNLNQVFTKDALSVISETSALIPNITLQDVSNQGTGDNPYISLRKPAKFAGRSGSSTWSGEDVKEEKALLSLTKLYGVDFSFTDSELSLSVDMISERYIAPAVRKLVSLVERDFYTTCFNYAGATVDGTGSIAGNTVLDKLFSANTKLNERGATGQRTFIGQPAVIEGIMKQSGGRFQDASEIGKQYKDGIAGRIAGFDVMDSYRIAGMSVGTGVDGSFTVTMTEGSTTITVATLAAGAIKAGQPFTIAGVYEVNEEGIQLPTLKVFRAVADCPAGSVVVQSPTYASGSLKNVSQLISGTSVAIDFQGVASAYQGLGFDKSAIVAGFVNLEAPKNVDKGFSLTEDGVSIRFARDWDIGTGAWKCRLDVQTGIVVARPELVCGVFVS